MTEAERELLLFIAKGLDGIWTATNSVWGSNDDKICELGRLVHQVEDEVAANKAIDELEAQSPAARIAAKIRENPRA